MLSDNQIVVGHVKGLGQFEAKCLNSAKVVISKIESCIIARFKKIENVKMPSYPDRKSNVLIMDGMSTPVPQEWNIVAQFKANNKVKV